MSYEAWGEPPESPYQDCPAPVCPVDGVLMDDQYDIDGEYWDDDLGPFPIFKCLICGSKEVDWD